MGFGPFLFFFPFYELFLGLFADEDFNLNELLYILNTNKFINSNNTCYD